MKTLRPKGTLTQGFYGNASSYYRLNGMKGHGAQDYSQFYKAPIESTVTGLVYAIRPAIDSETYTSVGVLAKDEDGRYYEYIHGHLLPSKNIKEGDYISQGTIIGFQSNYGECVSGGKKVLPQEKRSGKGSHDHYQKREVEASETLGEHHLRNSAGPLKIDGLYFNIKNYNNGFKGCLDPEEDFNENQN
jgi:hypothetical protein